MRIPAALTLALLTTCSPVRGPVDPGGTGGEAVTVTPECTVPIPPDDADLEVRSDLVYAVMDGQPQRLDIALPRGPGPHPLVVLIHGGGWYEGDKSVYGPEMRLLASQGYAAASVNYRLADAPRNVFPAAVEDVRCAVRWLRSRAGELRLDPSLVAALGSSAGGHLAAMLGTAADVEGLDGDCPLREVSASVDAVVAVAAPLDIRTAGALNSEQMGMVENFLGARPETVPERALLASPAVHAGAGDPPFLLIHGTADEVVPLEQSRSMRDTLRAAGVPATLVELPGVGHSISEFGAQPQFRASTCTALRFLRERLRLES